MHMAVLVLTHNATIARKSYLIVTVNENVTNVLGAVLCYR